MNEKQTPPVKLYGRNMVRWGTILFGTLAGSILVTLNFKKTGDSASARKSISIGILSEVILLLYYYFIPNDIVDTMPLFYIQLLYSIAFSFFWVWYQNELAETHRAKGGAFYSHWKGIVISLLCSFLCMFSALGIQLVKPPFPGNTMEFGDTRNMIYFSDNVDKKLVEQTGVVLKNIGFFSNESRKRLRIRKKDDDYWITLLILQKALADSEIIKGLNMIRTELQRLVFQRTVRLEIFEVKFPKNYQQEITGNPDDTLPGLFHESEYRQAFFSKLNGLSSDLSDIFFIPADPDSVIKPEITISKHSEKDIHLGIIVTKNEKSAREALDYIAKEGSFEQAAKKYSTGPNAKTGGDIGYVNPEDLHSSISAALKYLNETYISDIVTYDNQFVILKQYK
jgi:hypothetical protein